MSDPEFSRLRRDLEVIQDAAGLVLPFGWRDVWVLLGMVPCGLFIIFGGLTGYSLVGIIPLFTLGIVAAAFQVGQYRASGHRRSLRHGWIEAAVVTLAFAVLVLWEKWLGLPARPVRGAALFFLGAMSLVAALTSRQRRFYLGAAVGLIPFGIAAPLYSQQQMVVIGGAALIVGGLVGACILGWQLRNERSGDERATH